MAALSRHTIEGLAGILLAAALFSGLWLLLRYGSRQWRVSQGLRKALGSVADLFGAGRLAGPILAANAWFGRIGTIATVLSFVAWGPGIEGTITDAASAHLTRVAELDKRASKELAEQWSRSAAKELVSRSLQAVPPYTDAEHVVETLATWKQRAHALRECCKIFDPAALALFDGVKASGPIVPGFVSPNERPAELIPRSGRLKDARKLLDTLDASRDRRKEARNRRRWVTSGASASPRTSKRGPQNGSEA
jgi:hypothetical protein